MEPVLEIRVRLYPGRDDDLIRWLAELDRQSFGAKSQAVREALRRGLADDPASQSPAPASVDLGEIRAVVEAAVESALTRLEGLALVRSAPAEPEDETERLLDDLGERLML